MEFSEFVSPIFSKFRPSQTIWVNPMKHTPQNDPEWYRKCPQNRSGGRLLNPSGSQKSARTHVLAKTNLFETNCSKPLRQPYPNPAYRIYLKHRNSILKFYFCSNFFVGRTVGRTDGRTDGRSDGRTVGRTDGRTDGRSDGRTVKRTGGIHHGSLYSR